MLFRSVLRMIEWSDVSVEHGGEHFYDEQFLYAEPTFFDVFSFELRRGNLATALEEPFSLVITPEVKKKYFGDEPALGQTLTLNGDRTFTVTGVLERPPGPTHLPLDILVSWSTWETLPEGRTRSWGGLYAYTYVLPSEGVSQTQFQQQLADVFPNPVRERLDEMGMEMSLQLEPLTSIYLTSDRRYDIASTGDEQYVYLFVGVALLILLIACANFVNLATARSVDRAGEVGVRKSVGSTRGDLAAQFLTESVLTTTLAFGAALILVALAMPCFNDFAGTALSLGALPLPVLGGAVVGGILAVGLLAGSYPAFALSRFRPSEVLRGSLDRTAGRRGLRQGLVVAQFAMSVILIIGSLGAARQFRYMLEQDLGFEDQQVLVVNAEHGPTSIQRQRQTMKQELLRHSAIERVSATQAVPSKQGIGQMTVRPEGLPADETRRFRDLVSADHDYVETLGIELVAGRDFDERRTNARTRELLINRAAVDHFAWETPEAAVGKTVEIPGLDVTAEVVGVTENYHHYSLKECVQPIGVLLRPRAMDYYAVRFDPAQTSETLAHVRGVWEDLA